MLYKGIDELSLYNNNLHHTCEFALGLKRTTIQITAEGQR